MNKTFLLALLTGAFSTTAMAQSDYEDLDDPDDEQRRERRDRSPTIDREVREITKGFYSKANVGGAFYLLDFAGFVNAGTSLGLGVGSDFVNQEKTSMAWEVMFFQGIHNGMYYGDQGAMGCGAGAPCIQGDLRTYTFAGFLEYSKYPHRRWGVGVRVGGGVLLSPLLIDPTAYQDEVVQKNWAGYNPTYHSQPHPVVLGGPTVEYYTKLGHFSVGVDTDVFYAIGFDLGASVTGTMKYTF